MPETKKQFVLIKTTPSQVLFTLRSVANPQVSRQIYLTKRHPQQPLPLEWALSIVADPSLFDMYRKGYFTFDDNDALALAAFEAGYWFGEKFDFTPASKEDDNLIFSILKVGNRDKIISTIEKFGKDRVREVAIANLDKLTQNVIQVLEKIFGVQLTIDGVADLELAEND